MDNKKAQSKVVIVLLVVIAIALIVVAINSFRPKSTGEVIKEKELEKNVFDVKGWQITPTYIVLSIQNTGRQDYSIDGISIANCGNNNGGSMSKGYDVKTFSVLCNNKLTEGAPFIGEAIIRYSLLGQSYKGTETQTTTVSGNVMTKKCFYEVYGENIPYASGKCETKMDCINGVSNFRMYRNEERKINNQPQITSNDVTVMDCSYA